MSKFLEVVNTVLDAGLNGLGPLTGAKELADEYLQDSRYADDEARIDSLINWESSKNFASGFVLGLGGLMALPVTIPTSLGASWAVQARLVGAIAHIQGHDVTEDRVRTLILLSILGDAGKEVVKEAGVKVGNKLGMKAVEAIPGRVLIEINKLVGFRLITKAGEKGIINLIKLVPVAGGLVGGTIDTVVCRKVGAAARKNFAP
ncbi:EcsC family protein [Corallococcus sp. 4LFB]|uniref:EcsC family protein n=1 Tax=Corallococcus sp. 4LFB TaxID=3383249 RepID=UPI003974AC36